MIVVTTNDVPNEKIIQVKGIVSGVTVQSKDFGKDFSASLRTLVGGEIKSYSELMYQSRHIAMNRMIRQADEAGANAIVGMRYQSSQIMDNASEVIAYGTAVVLE